MRVLIADDSVLLREGLALILADGGHEVVGGVGDGEALVSEALRLRPDVVVADIRMPPSHTDEGLRATTRIRAQWPEAPILLLSQYVVAGYLPELLAEIGRLRLEREAARGGISMTTPEQVVEVTEAAEATEVAGEASPSGAAEPTERPGPAGYRLAYRVPVPAEQYNAQISLLTGMCAARIMVECGVGILRTLPPARPEDYARLRRVAAALGIDWPAAQPYPGLVRSLDHAVPAHAAFMEQAMSLFRGSGYLAFGVGGVGVPADDEAADSEEAVHSAIAARYAHVTAPLRRLVDRYGEEVCIAACAQAPVPEWVLQALPDLPGVMEQTGKRARAIGRGALTALEALVLRGHEGEVFDGVITSERDGRGELVLAEPAVVTEIRAGKKASDGGLPVGERVQVRLLTADPTSGIRFQLLRPEHP